MPWLTERYKSNWQKEYAEKISQALKGRKFTDTHKSNISKSKIGKIPWNKGKFGLIPPEKHPMWKGGEQTLPRCPDCGKRLATRKFRYCRKHCFIGSRNPMYKGDKRLTLLKYLLRGVSKYKEWRLAVFERDNYICQICSIRGGKLNADHYPVPFTFIVKFNQLKDLDQALSCSDLWDVNNGRTLCVPCHRKQMKKTLKAGRDLGFDFDPEIIEDIKEAALNYKDVKEMLQS